MVLALAAPGFARAAEVLNADGTLPERAEGRADAPLTITEYASLTCPHCAMFHRDILPEIKKTYVETGKVRFVYQDFPLDPLAMAASMVAHCTGGERYFGFLDVLFRSQASWAQARDPRAELKRLARFANLSSEAVDACLNDRALLMAIQNRARDAQSRLGIASTPTIFVGDRKVEGAMPFDRLKGVIDAALGN